MDFIQYFTVIGTLWESLLVNAFFAGAFDQITDFEIVFKFKRFFCHCISRKYIKIGSRLFPIPHSGKVAPAGQQ